MPISSLTEELAIAILFHYPELSGPLEEFGPMPQGLFNQNARLVVAGRPLVLKKLSPGRSEMRQRFGARLQKILADGGFPCPEVLCNAEGQVVTSHQGDLWSVQDWATGSHCPPDRRDGPEASAIRVAIGSAMGRLHTMAQDAQDQGMLATAPEDARLPLPQMISGIVGHHKKLFVGSLLKPSLVRRLKLTPGKTAAQNEILSMLPTLEKGCRQLEAWDPTGHPSLTVMSPCHGDINWENLFFQDCKLTAILDFDNAMEMNPAYEAAAAAAVVCADNPDHLEAFLAAYKQAAGTDIDQESVPHLMLLKCVRSLLYQIEVALTGGTGDDALARQWMRFLVKNIEKFTQH